MKALIRKESVVITTFLIAVFAFWWVKKWIRAADEIQETYRRAKTRRGDER